MINNVLNLDKEKIDEQEQIAREKIQSQEDIAQLRANVNLVKAKR